MKKNKYLPLMLLLFGIMSCTNQKTTTQDLENELSIVVDSWFENFNNNDADKLIELYDDSALFASHDFPLQKGKKTIKEGFINTFSLKPSIDFNIIKITVEGNIGTVLGEFDFHGINPSDNIDIRQNGRFLVVYKKFKDNKWRVIFDMDNHPPDVVPSTW
ncbi:DUF4440 domain-containing protein [Maribacter sp. BPC-D8]|uniref:YybH family protein n=1 Tax=Maribacter sp. BPC-D8 TaxID=3053613 RepID=UPI002B4A0AFF|nr:DUF4440 domain-containing protein [Maribacter sp. BPC-D8]WRI30555.1 DUF4440 domain-containing protein [Maribacter sp. BPC-D8]